MIGRTFLSLLLLCIMVTITAGQSTTTQNETESRVAELEKFHEVMYPIWHLEYPDKNFSALKEHSGEVSGLAKQIYSAKLPGILRDKKTKWENGIAEFKKAVNEYLKQSAGKDDNLLMKSVENLHTKYENLVRIIRPVLKEVDLFHRDLYVIYHTHLPANDYGKINDMSSGLVKKAAAITLAKLPARLSDKNEAFRIASASLLEAAKDLEARGSEDGYANITALVEAVHSKYQRLEEIF